MRTLIVFVLLSVIVLSGGCGYTYKSLLPAEFDSIHIKNFANNFDLSREVSDRRSNYSYRPGMETDITRAVIDEFIFDRNLKVVSEDKAALTLDGALIDFRQYPLSYSSDDSIEEYRLEIYVDIKLYKNSTKEILWSESRFMGQANY